MINIKNNKNDQRSKISRMLVKKSLIKLLTETPLNKITVAELCSEAEINRGTFYNHFYDVYDVYESIENEFFDEIISKFQNVKSYSFEKTFFREILLVVYRNLDLSVIIIKNLNSNIFKRVIAFVHDKYILEISGKYKKIPANVLEYIFSYTLNGSMGLLTEWVNNDMRISVDDIAELIEEFNTSITLFYVNKYQK